MLILKCVEQKKECKGPKWGGLLPISSLESRHCNDVTIGGLAACTAGMRADTTEDLHARTWGAVPRKACHDRPPWVLCHDREFPVAIESSLSRQRWIVLCRDRGLNVATGFGRLVSRHSLGVATDSSLWAVLGQVRAQHARQSTQHAQQSAQRVTEGFCHDRELFIATSFTTFFVAIEKYLSRQTSRRTPVATEPAQPHVVTDFLVSQQGKGLGQLAVYARDNEQCTHTVHTIDLGQCTVLCTVWVIVLGHCTQTLFMDTV